MDTEEIKQLKRQVSKLQLEAKLRKSVANELERQRNLVQKARDEAEEQKTKFEKASARLSQYLSPQICEQILVSEEFNGLETTKKNLTVFFSDIVDFTALSERMSPDKLKNFLHFYMTEMSDIAIKFGGTIDKYIGDSIMVFFGDPATDGYQEDAKKCFRMALRMQETLEILREKIKNDFKLHDPLRIRIGMHSGRCNVGNFGSRHRLEYTAIGRAVNVAARLEKACEEDGILCSEITFGLLEGEAVNLRLRHVKAKGVDGLIKAYQWNIRDVS
jgi:class 3 adenylate cyclase